jgi:hypothetical protein
METKPKINPEYLPEIEQFQRIFCRYFPAFEDDIYDAAGEMSWLHNGVFTNPIDTVRRSKAKNDLRKLASFVRTVSKWNLPLLYSLLEAKLELKKSDERVARGLSDIYDFILACDEMEHDGVVEDVLEAFITGAERDIERLPETRNINWEAVNAVGRLRTLWWRNTGVYAPSRALNPASLFACYLQDGYTLLLRHTGEKCGLTRGITFGWRGWRIQLRDRSQERILRPARLEGTYTVQRRDWEVTMVARSDILLG